MTVDELVNHIADELNLTAPDAKSRILKEINVRYRQVTSSIGLITSRRVEIAQDVTLHHNDVTFLGIEKIDALFYKITTPQQPILPPTQQTFVTTNKTLDLITDDEMLKERQFSVKPTKYSIFSMAPNKVTIQMNCVPEEIFTLYARGLADASTLSGTVSPAFPSSFHDILIYGVEADEYKRKEKTQLATDAETKFQERLSDLRMFIAKSAYQDLHRGKHSKADDWWDYNRNQ